MIKIDPVELLNAAAEASKKAYAPYSHFPVGSALLGKNGKIYSGCNVENASFGLTNCAERTALFSAVVGGEREFVAIAIVAGGREIPYPCGACRQVLAEFCKPDTPVFVALLDDLSKFQHLPLGHLLPNTFKF
jgi:cytidine deaminase